jgi:hypothetical protein
MQLCSVNFFYEPIRDANAPGRLYRFELTSLRRIDHGDKVGTIERVMIDKRSGQWPMRLCGDVVWRISRHWRRISRAALERSAHYDNLDACEGNVTDEQLHNAPLLATGWDIGTIDPHVGTQPS